MENYRKKIKPHTHTPTHPYKHAFLRKYNKFSVKLSFYNILTNKKRSNFNIQLIVTHRLTATATTTATTITTAANMVNVRKNIHIGPHIAHLLGRQRQASCVRSLKANIEK